MPSGGESEPQIPQRRRSPEVAPSTDTPQPPVKRQKRSRRNRTPPQFWDNLSQLPLCLRALREFNRRITRPVVPKPPARSILKGDLVKQLKRFARHGGPNLRDIRGYSAQETEAPCTMSSSQSRPSGSGIGNGTDPSRAKIPTKKKTLSSKDPAFEQALIDARIYPYAYEYSDDDETPIPDDTEEILERLRQPRPSLSPSRFTTTDFRNFDRANERADSEDAVRSNVFPIIRGRSAIPSGQNKRFNHVKALASYISEAQPDYYDGSRPAQLDRRVRSDLKQYIIPCSQTHRPLLPNHFTELKGPEGSNAEMKRQIIQDLGNGARGMLAIQSYGQDGYKYDNKAYTFGWTYNSGTGTLQLYAMHPTQPADPSERPQYHTTRLGSYAMTNDIHAFREGATRYRNSRDLAKEYRDAAIAQANAIAVQARSTTNAEHGGVSNTSAGEADGPESRQTVTSQDELGEASNPSLGAPCVSRSQEDTIISADGVYFTSQTAQASETTMDDPDPKTHPRKRTSRLRDTRPRKRNTAGSSGLAAQAATTSGEASTTCISTSSSPSSANTGVE